MRPGGLSRSVRAFLSPAEAPDQRLCADSGSGSSRSGPGSAAHVTVRYPSWLKLLILSLCGLLACGFVGEIGESCALS